MAEFRIEPLGPDHERAEFCCGRQPLDEFIRTLVSQYEKRNLGRTYVALRGDENRIWGYYTLASGAVSFQTVPKKVSRKLPKHPVPVALLGRLAVDQSAQGQSLGEMLLIDALRRCLNLSEQLGVYAVEVHALDVQAKSFYEKYGFVPLLDNDLHLYLPIATLRGGLTA
jgi:GNAT superfamily N-acetyltransferase